MITEDHWQQIPCHAQMRPFLSRRRIRSTKRPGGSGNAVAYAAIKSHENCCAVSKVDKLTHCITDYRQSLWLTGSGTCLALSRHVIDWVIDSLREEICPSSKAMSLSVGCMQSAREHRHVSRHGPNMLRRGLLAAGSSGCSREEVHEAIIRWPFTPGGPLGAKDSRFWRNIGRAP